MNNTRKLYPHLLREARPPPPAVAFLLSPPLAQVTSLCTSHPSSAAMASAAPMALEKAWRIWSTMRPALGESRSRTCSCAAKSRPLSMSSITCSYGAAAAIADASSITLSFSAGSSETTEVGRTESKACDGSPKCSSSATIGSTFVARGEGRATRHCPLALAFTLPAVSSVRAAHSRPPVKKLSDWSVPHGPFANGILSGVLWSASTKVRRAWIREPGDGIGGPGSEPIGARQAHGARTRRGATRCGVARVAGWWDQHGAPRCVAYENVVGRARTRSPPTNERVARVSVRGGPGEFISFSSSGGHVLSSG
jgi:hypothetical protein